MKNPYVMFDTVFVAAAVFVYTVAGTLAFWTGSIFMYALPFSFD